MCVSYHIDKNMMKIYNIYVYSPQKSKKLNDQVQKVTLENIEHKNYLISSSRQVGAFDLFIKIRFFNSLYLVSLFFNII